MSAPSGEAMDRIIERGSRWPRWAAVAGVIALLGGAGFYFLSSDGKRSRAVEGSHITIGEVTRAQFDDVIPVRGRVTPLRTTYVDTASGGHVEQILVEDGARVERGQLLVVLTNTELQLDLISREAQITEQMNDLRGLELAQANTRLTHEREMVEVKYQIKRLTRQTNLSHEMVASGASPTNELDDLKDELDYYKMRLHVLLKTRAASDKLQRAQLVQMRAANEQLDKNLDIARRNLESLQVKAPADGQVSAFTLEVGQSLGPGDRIAQIDDPNQYKVVADIDEFYLSRVDLGQHADYPQKDKTYPLKVAKIRPQVQNGQFQVELTFTGETPADVRRGQTAQVRLRLAQPEEGVLIPNGAFYNDTGGAWVFVVSSDRTRAVKRNVRLGRRNPSYIEVLEGLSPGEKIVISPYTNYLDMDRLDLTR